MGLVEDFERVIEEAEQLEEVSIPMRLKRRIANAYARAIEKALTFSLVDNADPLWVEQGLRRHSRRGAQDYVP